MRLGYGVSVLLLDVTGHPTDKFALSLAAKVCLSTVPEMVVTLVFIVFGLLTRNIAGAYWKEGNERRQAETKTTTSR